MESILSHYLDLSVWKPIAYLVVFIVMILEGDVALFAAGFLTHQEFFQFLPIILTLFSGVFLGDNLWYRLGNWLNNSTSFFERWIEKIAKPFDEHLRNKPIRTIFISKFTYGFNKAMLMRAGALGIKWKKLEESDLLATFFWIIIVGGLGYASSASLIAIKKYLRFGEIAFAIGIVVFIIIEFLVTKKAKRKL